MTKTKTELAADVTAAESALEVAASAMKASNSKEARDAYREAYNARDAAVIALKGKRKSAGGGSRIGRARATEEAAQLKAAMQRAAESESRRLMDKQRDW
jgi:hypothetical protein